VFVAQCRHHVDGVTGRIRRAYCFDAQCAAIQGTCIQGNPFKEGTRMLATSYGLSQVRTAQPAAASALHRFCLPCRLYMAQSCHAFEYQQGCCTALWWRVTKMSQSDGIR
jgi:hypothetical protein